MPDFVRRPEPMIPLLQSDTGTSTWLLWVGSIFALFWMMASAAYFFMQPIGDLQSLSPLGLLSLFAAILFPALTILLFFIAAHKLNKVTENAQRLTEISQILLKADDTAAGQAKNLAGSIRHEMNQLNEELANLTDRLKFLQENASDHAELLNSSSSSFLATSDVIGQNLTTQRQSLESMSQTTEARLDSLLSMVSMRKDALIEATAISAKKLDAAGLSLEQQLGKYEGFVANFEAQLSNATKTLKQSEGDSKALIIGLSQQTTDISATIETLKSENTRLETLLSERLGLLQTLNQSNNEANEALTETIQHSLNATDKMREETIKSQAALGVKREELLSTITSAENKTKQTLSDQNALILSKLTQTEAILSKLDSRVDRLQKNTDAVEAQQLAHAETRDMGLEIPEQPKKKSAGGRLNLTPLDTDREQVVYQSKTDIPTEGSYDLTIEPLELGADMRLPSSSGLVNTASDLIRPLSTNTPLFGGAKKKEKSPWRWKDMMGGFDNADNTPEDNQDSNLSMAPLGFDDNASVEEQNFEAWLQEFDLNANAIVSDGTILDVANAMSLEPENTISVLRKRLPEISDHLISLSEDTIGFSKAAKIWHNQFAETLNPEIMNRDAIRNQLSTREGKIYLLSILASQR